MLIPWSRACWGCGACLLRGAALRTWRSYGLRLQAAATTAGAGGEEEGPGAARGASSGGRRRRGAPEALHAALLQPEAPSGLDPGPGMTLAAMFDPYAPVRRLTSGWRAVGGPLACGWGRWVPRCPRLRAARAHSRA
jgi:hypothetical protein